MKRNLSRGKRCLGALLVFAVATMGAMAHAHVLPAPSGWSEQFLDDFQGDADVLPSQVHWRFSVGHSYPGGPENWGTGETQFYTADVANVSLDGTGNLRITPLRDVSGRWTSARIETNQQNFKAPAGGIMRVQARIRMPDVSGSDADGYWPAFWMLGSPYRGTFNWPAVGEFDIMENVNGLNRVWGVLHCGYLPGGPCNESDGIGANVECPDVACQADFHDYAMEWDRSRTPEQLRWYVDGQLYHQVQQSELPDWVWQNMAEHEGFFILLNVAMGGAFPNALAEKQTPTASTRPGASMLVDYVSVWTKSGSSFPYLDDFTHADGSF